MKKILSFTFATLFVFNAFAQEMKFETGTWAEIKAKAKKENKLIFVDAFTTWCGPCKMMAKNTFTNKEVADYYNANFINAKIDMEKGEGLDIAKEYKVTCYPNLVYINGDGKLIHRAAGYLESEPFIEQGKTAYTPAKAFGTYQEKYDKGERNPEFVLAYLEALSQTCFSSSEVATGYLTSLNERELIKHANWQILYHHIEDITAAPFQYMVQNRHIFEDMHTADSVNNKIYDTYLKYGLGIIKSNDNVEEKYQTLVTGINSFKSDRSAELLYELAMAYSKSKGDWDGYFRAALPLIDQYRSKDSQFLNNVSWAIFEHGTQKKQFSTAELWAKMSTDLNAQPYNLDTYANLQFKNQKVKEAIETEKKALEMAKAQGEDTKPYEEMIAEFEKGLK